MTRAESLIDLVDEVTPIQYKKFLYNILLETHETMIVNNLTVETLHPENMYAKLVSKKSSPEEKSFYSKVLKLMNKVKEDGMREEYEEEFQECYKKFQQINN